MSAAAVLVLALVVRVGFESSVSGLVGVDVSSVDEDCFALDSARVAGDEESVVADGDVGTDASAGAGAAFLFALKVAAAAVIAAIAIAAVPAPIVVGSAKPSY